MLKYAFYEFFKYTFIELVLEVPFIYYLILAITCLYNSSYVLKDNINNCDVLGVWSFIGTKKLKGCLKYSLIKLQPPYYITISATKKNQLNP